MRRVVAIALLVALASLSCSGASPEDVVSSTGQALSAAREEAVGSFVEFPLPTLQGTPLSLTTGPDQALWFTELRGHAIGRITANGEIQEFPLPAESVPFAITVGADHNLWFTDDIGTGTPDNLGRIGVITTDGQLRTLELGDPGGVRFLTLGPDGNIWFTHTADFAGTHPGYIGRISVTGVVKRFPLPTEMVPFGIVSGPDGNLWFVETTQNKIARMSPTGRLKEFSLPSGGLPQTLIIGPDHNLWFDDSNANAIGRMTLGGSFTEFPIPTAHSLPFGLTTGADGAVWFAESGGNRLGRLTTTGELAEFVLPNSNSGPLSVIRGPDQNLWFGEAGPSGSKIGSLRVRPARQRPAPQLFAWGYNFAGQLGDGSTDNSDEPVPVLPLGEPKSLAAGSDHSLALMADGSVWGWGSNDLGELGIGVAGGAESRPVHVTGLDHICAVAAGGHNGAALHCDGTVSVWGANDYGELGNGSGDYAAHATPQLVPGLTGVIELAVGDNHILALRRDGTVWGWGSNYSGQLANGAQVSLSSPTLVDGRRLATGVGAGSNSSLILLRDGTVWALGSNGSGQLGVGTTDSDRHPLATRVIGLPGRATKIASGGFHELVLVAGDVWAWGYNAVGELGNGTGVSSPTPVMVSELHDVDDIGAGGYHSVALSRGRLWAWGRNDFGELGNGSFVGSAVPVLVPGLRQVRRFAAGAEHILADGVVAEATVSWGFNASGQLGDGTSINRDSPAPVANLEVPSMLAAGDDHSVALLAGGTAVAWGLNDFGQLGNDSAGPGSHTPVPVTGIEHACAIAAGGRNAAALLCDGSVALWGANDYGELGTGTADHDAHPLPQSVPDFFGITKVAIGENHVLALRGDGTVWGWGSNYAGQLGDGTQVSFVTPALVDGRGLAVDIAAGWNFSLILLRDGTVWALGLNASGQLGVGTIDSERHAVATQVLGLPGPVQKIAAGGFHELALSQGQVWAWGYNAVGELGTGSATTSALPLLVSGLDQVTDIGAGAYHSIALRDGRMWAWGRNDYGELGNGSFATSTVPVRVPHLAHVSLFASGAEHVLAVAR